MLNGHQGRFDTWVNFLEKNNLPHIYQEGEDRGAAFEAAIGETEFPAEMPTLPNQSVEHLRARMIWQATDTRSRLAKLEGQMKPISKFIANSANLVPAGKSKFKSVLSRFRPK